MWSFGEEESFGLGTDLGLSWQCTWTWIVVQSTARICRCVDLSIIKFVGSSALEPLPYKKKTGQSDQPLPGKDRKHRASSSNSLWQHKREEKRAVCIRFTECTYGQSSALSFVAFPSLLSLSFSLLLFSPLFPCVGVLFIIFMFSRLVLEMAWPRATIMLISLTDIGFGDHRHAPVNPDRVIRPFQYSLALTELDLEHQARKFSHNGRGGFRN